MYMPIGIKSRNFLIRVILLFLPCLSFSGRAGAEWFADAKAGALYEDNLTRAFDDADRKKDTAFLSAVSAGYYYQLTGSDGLSLATDIKSSSYAKYSSLDNIFYGLSCALKHKIGMGTQVPWIRIYGSVSGNTYREGLKDSGIFGSGFHAGKQISPRGHVQAGYDYEKRNAKNPVFDQESSRGSVSAGYSLTKFAGLSLGYSYRYGDVAIYYAPIEEKKSAASSSAPPPPPLPYVISAGGKGLTQAKANVGSFDTLMTAENARATTHSFLLDISLALNRNFHVDFGFEHRETNAWGRNYPGNLLKAEIGYSY